MRIAIVAPPWVPVPPPAYGGTETVLDTLARGLKNAGHEVLLCTTGDSTCDVEKTWIFEQAVGFGVGGTVSEIRHILHAYKYAVEADVVHDHTLSGPLYALSMPKLPVVTTNHGPFNEDLNDLYETIATRIPIISISKHQASTAGDIPIAATIHHGVHVDEFPMGDGLGGYALFLGRMHPGKGADVAARVAKEAGFPLRLAGKMREPEEIHYFESQVEPLLGGDRVYVGEVDHETKLELLGHATCLLNPIVWPEPFGMVMIEALASGTPVITTPFGAAPEIVEDGVIGYVCQTESDLVAALRRIHEIDRATCRVAVEQRFSARHMVDQHIALYEKVIEDRSQTYRSAPLR